MFAGVKLNGELTFHANFQSFGTAFLTLIRISTGEAWHAVMYAAVRKGDSVYTCKDS